MHESSSMLQPCHAVYTEINAVRAVEACLEVLGQPAVTSFPDHGCCVPTDQHGLACHKRMVVIQLVRVLMSFNSTLYSNQ